MEDGNKGLGIGSAGKELGKAFKEGTLFRKSNVKTGGTGYAPNADQAKPIDDTDELQKIAEGADPEAVRQMAAQEQAKVYNPQEYEMARSQSLVFSQREITEAQLEAVRAQNEEAMRAQQRQIAENKAKRTGLKITVVVIAIAVVIAAIALIVAIFINRRKPVSPTIEDSTAEETELSSVDGYNCETSLCGKAADLPDGRILLRDTEYYIYDIKKQERTSTTIDTQDYNSIRSFNWSGKTYLELDPNSDPSALYSVSDNRYITSYGFDAFYDDINNAGYDGMRDIASGYILARANGSYKLVDLNTGKAVVSGANRVFAHDGFFFGYEANNMVYAYTTGAKAIVSIHPDSQNKFFTRNGILIVVTNGEDLVLYSRSGATITEGAVYDEVYDHSGEECMPFLLSNANFYRIPEN